MKKVRIKDFSVYPRYEGQIGTVIEDCGHIWKVRMLDNYVIMPYSPSYRSPQCEEIPNSKSEVITNYQIY